MAIQPSTAFWDTAGAILQGLGAPRTATNLRILAAWMGYEHGWQADPMAYNNPMNTTLSAPGASDFNSVGVKKYPTAAEGIQATVNTLTNGDYPVLVKALQSGDANLFFSQQGLHELDTWGGSSGYGSELHTIYQDVGTPPQAVMTAGVTISPYVLEALKSLGKLFGLDNFTFQGNSTQLVTTALVVGVVVVLLWKGGEDLGL